MVLHKAIKEIVASKGAEMICDIQIINCLLDYQAFKEQPATKLILRAIIDSGYAENILALINTNGWETKFKQYQHELIDACGFKENLTQYVFNSIAYGLSMIDTAEQLKISERLFDTDSEGSINREENTIIKPRQTVNGCRLGDFVELQLPCGDSIVCKLEYIEDGLAGIRLKSFVMCKVSDELVIPTTKTKCTLPEWFTADYPRKHWLDILLGYRKS